MKRFFLNQKLLQIYLVPTSMDHYKWLRVSGLNRVTVVEYSLQTLRAFNWYLSLIHI